MFEIAFYVWPYLLGSIMVKSCSVKAIYDHLCMIFLYCVWGGNFTYTHQHFPQTYTLRLF